MKKIPSYIPHIIVFTVIFGMLGCNAINKYFGLENDNVIENLTGDVIEAETGIDIDLSIE